MIKWSDLTPEEQKAVIQWLKDVYYAGRANWGVTSEALQAWDRAGRPGTIKSWTTGEVVPPQTTKTVLPPSAVGDAGGTNVSGAYEKLTPEQQLAFAQWVNQWFELDIPEPKVQTRSNIELYLAKVEAKLQSWKSPQLVSYWYDNVMSGGINRPPVASGGAGLEEGPPTPDFEDWLDQQYGAGASKDATYFTEAAYYDYWKNFVRTAPGRLQVKFPGAARSTGDLPTEFITNAGVKVPVTRWQDVGQFQDESGQPITLYVPIIDAASITPDVLASLPLNVYGVDANGRAINDRKPVADMLDTEDLDALKRTMAHESVFQNFSQKTGVTKQELLNNPDMQSVFERWSDFQAAGQPLGDNDQFYADVLKTRMGTRPQQNIKLEGEEAAPGDIVAATPEEAVSAWGEQQARRIFYPGEKPSDFLSPNDVMVANSAQEAADAGFAAWIPVSEWFGQNRHEIAKQQTGWLETQRSQGVQTPERTAGESLEQSGRWYALGQQGQPWTQNLPPDQLANISNPLPVSPPWPNPQQAGPGVISKQQQAAQADFQKRWAALSAKAQKASEARRLASARPEFVAKL